MTKPFRQLVLITFTLFYFIPVYAYAQPTEKAGHTTALDDLGRLANQEDMLMKTVQSEAGGLTWAKIMAYLIFGGVGFVAFSYGKKMEKTITMLIGLVLMVYPFAVGDSTFLLYAVGIVLSVALYYFRN